MAIVMQNTLGLRIETTPVVCYKPVSELVYNKSLTQFQPED